MIGEAFRFSPATPPACAAALLTLLLLLAACDATFEPIEASDYRYSITGYLNPSVDTQWIRIMPLRGQGAFTDSRKLDATVTVHDLDDGSSFLLRDSVFAYESAAFLEGAETTYAHNFWTTERIHYEHSYRLVIEAPDGTTAGGVVRVPEDFTYVIEMQPGRPAVVETRVKYLSMIVNQLWLPADCYSYKWTLGFRYPMTPAVDGLYRVPLVGAGGGGPSCPILDSAILIVASDREDWPVGPSDAAWAFPSLEISANLFNAVGFFSGIVTKRIPQTTCVVEPVVVCRITISADAGVLKGKVTDAACGGPPRNANGLVGGSVQLTELPDSPSDARRIQTAAVAADGSYLFETIDPGRRYVLTFSYPTARILGVPTIPIYGSPSDTISYGSTERSMEFDVRVPRLVPC